MARVVRVGEITDAPFVSCKTRPRIQRDGGGHFPVAGRRRVDTPAMFIDDRPQLNALD